MKDENDAEVRYVVSACLAGARTRYDGTDARLDAVRKLVAAGKAIPVCPEQLGGLGTPRATAEVRGGDGEATLEGRATVITESDYDTTDSFIRGAEEALGLAELFGASAAILKSRSPSCGCHRIYDGSFTGRLVDGDGVFAALLRRRGFALLTEEELEG